MRQLAILVPMFALMLGACGSRADPPLTDEALLGAPTGAVRTPAAPNRGGGERGAAVARDACSGDPLVSGRGWADRLPAAFPLYPGSRLVEAGGVERGCGLRIVRFRTDAARSAVLDWYARRARAAGYSVDREERGEARLIGGTRGDDAFVVSANVVGGGSQVELLANAGR